jgi:hypothetical protein
VNRYHLFASAPATCLVSSAASAAGFVNAGVHFSWRAPRPDLGGVEPTSSPYGAVAFWVDQAGRYQLGARWRFEEDLPTRLLLYAGGFEPESPLRNLIAVSDDARLELGLAEEAIYYLVVTTTAGSSDRFAVEVSGPGEPELVGCYPSDEVDYTVGASVIGCHGLLARPDRAKIGVSAERMDVLPPGAGLGELVPAVSRRAVGFRWTDDDWQLQVRLLDRCASHGFLWVVLARATHLPLRVRLQETSLPLREKTYELTGPVLPTVVDRQAFSCAAWP